MDERIRTEDTDAWIQRRTDELSSRLLPVLVECVGDLRVAIEHVHASHEKASREAFLAFGDYEDLARDAGICLALVARGVGAEVAEARLEPEALRALGRFVEESFLRVGKPLQPGPEALPRIVDRRPGRARDLTLLLASLLLRAGECAPPGTAIRWRFEAGQTEDRLEILTEGDTAPLEPAEAVAWARRLRRVEVVGGGGAYRVRVPRGRLAVAAGSFRDRS